MTSSSRSCEDPKHLPHSTNPNKAKQPTQTIPSQNNSMSKDDRDENVQVVLTPESAAADAVYDSLDSFAACFCCNPFEDFLPELIAIQGQAFDVIVVQSATTGRVASSDFRISFDHPSTPFPPKANGDEAEDCQALLEIVDDSLGKVYFPIDHNSSRKRSRLREPPKCDSMTRSAAFHAQKSAEKDEGPEQATLRLLAKMLKPGKNEVRYLFRTESRVLGAATASVYLWSDRDKVVVCDVDGTITKSNLRGIYDTIVAEKYVHCHDRVCEFLTHLKNGGSGQDDSPEEEEKKAATERPNVNVLYLSSRPLAIANSTRKFLSNLKQPHCQEGRPRPRRSWSRRNSNTMLERTASGEHHRLPDGPLIGFPGKLTEVLKMELVTHSVHFFKASTLLEQVVKPFCIASKDPEIHTSLFIAGFGNTLMDVMAYYMAGMNPNQIYLIDKQSRISCLDAVGGLLRDDDEEQQQDEKQRRRGSNEKQRRRGSNDKALRSNNTLLLATENVLPAEGDEQSPVLRMPLSRKSYKNVIGTIFQGYRDESIVSHVFSEKLIEAMA